MMLYYLWHAPHSWTALLELLVGLRVRLRRVPGTINTRLCDVAGLCLSREMATRCGQKEL
jgi:hypothetical protein